MQGAIQDCRADERQGRADLVWLDLFNSLFQPMPKNLTTTSGTWSRLEVEP
ncbi:hypothetical protein SERLADRAFT_443353 [Serpula lacrymans var. lacrymans S7.9]|uniref:Uncharacterized protein n=1 Tax=Serpula lacrymans var. lacrymans (strain S7.9) TaxID=578457 RepID=F8PCA7_SERL9|nr:uncharacterized protein SERLADRAFT_443353 [Serpula lacrymans var. lacrymans S7.9]EGO19307.1 hypothetical protein SERLADRAFT_443353 [Serpula lacrymans var. lacrymans S7.9]